MSERRSPRPNRAPHDRAPRALIDRRRFIEAGVAGSVLCGAAASVAWGTANSIGRDTGASVERDTTRSTAWDAASAAFGRARPHAVLYDERFAEAIRFGHAAEQHGLPLRPIRGDVTRIWYDELAPLWRRQPRPIAGLTAYAALFCLERLARDHGMRVVHHDTYPAPDLGAPLHAWVIAPPPRIDIRHA
ncbi:MAG: hypothetical protein ACRETB_10215 [Steroidobacteraceae bacterium]